MKPPKGTPQHRKTTRIRDDFVAPERKAKSPTISREQREPNEAWHKTNSSKEFCYFAPGDTIVGFRPARRARGRADNAGPPAVARRRRCARRGRRRRRWPGA